MQPLKAVVAASFEHVPFFKHAVHEASLKHAAAWAQQFASMHDPHAVDELR
jgi:hypothetical protein